MKQRGGCHCGRVSFEVDAPRVRALECNCSICTKRGTLDRIVPRSAFRLLTSWGALSTYTFNTRVAKHLFCKVCGVQSFYVPRSHPDGIRVNVRCLEGVDVSDWEITAFDGRHWEEARSEID